MDAPPKTAAAPWQRTLLQIYRLAVLLVITWIIRTHHVRLQVEGAIPIAITDVRAIYPRAAKLTPDPSARGGMTVSDDSGATLGYVLRTAPHTDSIIGYRGWTDTLIAFDPALKVLGVKIHRSQDTREHVEDITTDRDFLKTWNGKSWQEVAGITPEAAGIEGVSGATMTSMAVAEAIMRRLQAADSALAITPPPLNWRARDYGLLFIQLAAGALLIIGTHGRKWLRRAFQCLVVLYVGLLTGDMLTESLMFGWAQAGAPWRSAPGLVLLLAAALTIPWATGKALYCKQLCPHGALQELLHSAAPKRWRWSLPKELDRGLRWLPPALLALGIIVSILLLPIDLAHVEAFDAYIFKTAGAATILIAIIGLIVSFSIPMAYCHYGCPTGALLNFIRARGTSDHFGRRDCAALFLVAMAWLLTVYHPQIHALMTQF